MPGEQRIFLSRAVLPRRERWELQEKGSQEDGISKTQSKEIKIEELEVKWNVTSEAPNITGAISSDRPTREHKAPSPLLPQTLRHIELRRRLGQNKAFLPALERALIKARGRLAAHHQNLKQGPTSRENKDGQCMVWLLEDSIQKVKAGTYHLR